MCYQLVAVCQYHSYTYSTQDLSFLMDAMHIISLQVKSKDLPIRVQAAWSLGNLCDVLRGREEILTPLVYVQLLDACLSTCKDHERVRVNSIRALGHLLYGLQDKHLSERYSTACYISSVAEYVCIAHIHRILIVYMVDAYVCMCCIGKLWQSLNLVNQSPE